MKIRITTIKRVTWRHRFLEIARQFEAVQGRSQAAGSGLRPRARMAGFATLRRARPAAPGML